MSSFARDILELLPKAPLRMVPITCVSTSPFQVSIFGTDTDVPARAVSGQSFDLGDDGMALWQPPLPPICFKTT